MEFTSATAPDNGKVVPTLADVILKILGLSNLYQIN